MRGEEKVDEIVVPTNAVDSDTPTNAVDEGEPQERDSGEIVGLLPYLQEQQLNLADRVIAQSLIPIPQQVIDYFWEVLGIDLIVNNFYETDLHLLRFKILRVFLDMLGKHTLKDLRKNVKLRFQILKPRYRTIVYEDGTEAQVIEGMVSDFETIELNYSWMELFDKIVLKAELMASRSRRGFTMDKLTSFKIVSGQSLELETKNAKARII